MRPVTLLRRNLSYYWRTNLAVILGVATSVAVLAGALLMGDSVRASLRDLFLGRLGNTDQVIASSGFFREKLVEDLQSHNQFGREFRAVCPLIALEGLVTHQESGRRGSGVLVYGVDEQFWKFHGRQGVDTPQAGRDVSVSVSLAQELGLKLGDSIVLRVEKPSAIPAGSLHGRKDDLGRTSRFIVRNVLSAAALGEFSVRPQQGNVRAVFVPLKRLQRELEQDGKVNTILVSEKSRDANSQLGLQSIERLLKETYALEDLGIRLRILKEGHCFPAEGTNCFSLESDSILVSDSLAEAVRAAAAPLGMPVIPILTYLANTIRCGQREIPYSLVTAISPWQGKVDGKESLAESREDESQGPESSISLNEWAARELGARLGDSISLEYMVWQEEGRLLTRTTQFQLDGIFPMKDPAADPDLAPIYPGITSSDSLHDWDPPFPIDLGRIRPRDEEYWDRYRTTPKALIPLEKGQELWHSRYGKLTSIRLVNSRHVPVQSALNSYEEGLRAVLDPFRMGFSVYPVRAQGLEASQGATDFGEYFLYFSFFLVVSALLLTALFFKLGVEQRLREIGILRAIGFPARRIRRLFVGEGIILATLGSFIGLAGAVAYAGLIMLGLRTWWVDAVGTSLLSLHVSSTSLALGWAGGVLCALVCIVWTLRSLTPASPRSLLTGSLETGKQRVQESGKRRTGDVENVSELLSSRFSVSRFLRFSSSRAAFLFSLLGIFLLVGALLGWVGELAGFFGAGMLLLIGSLCYLSLWLHRSDRNLLQGSGWWSISRLGFRNATSRPGRSVLCIALIASASFVIVAVDAFRRDVSRTSQDKKSGSGGFPLLAESLLPLLHDPNTAEGRRSLNLLSQQDPSPEKVRFTRFRVRPGEDTSCLNLYRPKDPRILAPTANFVQSGRFSFRASLAKTQEEKKNPWLLLDIQTVDGAVPVIADANSMTYVLHLKLGDEWILNQDSERPVRLRLVGALADSLFQGELLMSEKNFIRLFPDQQGFRFFLLDVAPENVNEATAFLEDRLSDFGFDVLSTAERLASFHRVENSYLSTFQTLGGLGLIMGTLGLVTVLLRNVLERRRELALLRAVGYKPAHFTVLVMAENALLLFFGLLTGTVCALIAIGPALLSRGGHMPAFSLGLLLPAVVVTGMAASALAVATIIRSPLLAALRAE
jgi:ABC-type lipoprotein release transport system permease subunit